MKNLEEKFTDVLEGTLSQAERESILVQIEADPELKKSFQDFQQILEIEQELASEDYSLHENFVVKVMDELEEATPGFLERLTMKLTHINSNTGIFAGASMLVVALICIQLLDTSQSDISKIKTLRDIQASEKVITPLPTETEVKKLVEPPSSKEVFSQKKDAQIITPDNLVELEEASGRKNSKPAASSDEDRIRAEKMVSDVAQQNPSLNQPVSSVTRGVVVPKPGKAEGLVAGAVKQLSSTEIKGIVAKRKQAIGWTEQSRTRHFSDGSMPSRLHLPTSINSERYGEWVENARTLTSSSPISTFSIDVDTGSYTNARRFLQMGQLPPTNSIRTEEFLNYFKYSYPVQTEKPFTLSYEIAPSPGQTGRHLLKLGIKARDSIGESKPWNLVFLVDVSGSMSSANKLGLVKRSLHVLTNNMRPGDRVALVTYAGHAGVVLPSTGIENKAQILAAIDRLGAGGSTHGSAGIQTAYQIAERSQITNGVNRVILATDGDFNVGITDRNALIRLIEEKRKSGITLTSLGFGTGNYNEAMMEQIANKGNGNYFYIDSFKEARKVFEIDLLGTIEVVAKDVKLQIEFNPAQVLEYRLVGYENRKLREQDFNNDAIDAGEIGAGHTVTALYEVVLADSPQAQQLISDRRYSANKQAPKTVLEDSHGAELAFLKIRHKAPTASQSTLMSFPIEKQHVQENFQKASDDFRFASAVSMFANILRNSQYKGSASFAEVISIAQNAQGEDEHGLRREFVELVKNAQSLKP